MIPMRKGILAGRAQDQTAGSTQSQKGVFEVMESGRGADTMQLLFVWLWVMVK
jgi:hypothetical protein